MSVKKAAEARRNKEGRWLPGQSPNPGGGGGRPRISQDIKDAFRALGHDALKVLRDLMLDVNQRGTVRVQAATAILDRAYGRPSQALEIQLAEMTDDQLIARASTISERIGAYVGGAPAPGPHPTN